MVATSRLVPGPSPRGAAPAIGGVTPSWLESRLAHADLRILDVRADAPRDDASGTRLRSGGNVELRPFAHLGAPPAWKMSRERYPARRGLPPAYVQGHIPGAVALDVRAVLFDEAGDVVSAPELAIAMSGLGVGDGHTIVLVDEGRPDAAVAAAWALARYGHRDVHVLEGGFARWVGEGRAVSREILRHPPASFTARVPS
jgi:3-mercaptopyruvate sulfurtransferase SseA